MGLFDLFDGVRYEKKLRKIKEEHFQRVADLEDKIHHKQMEHRELEVKHKHDTKEIEQKYKLEVQEIVSRHEKELKVAIHKLDMEKDKFEVAKDKLTLAHEQEMNAKKLQTEKEVYEKLTKLVEREGQAKETIVAAQADILTMLKDAVPNVNWDRQDGSPKLAIEHHGEPSQTVTIDDKRGTPKKPRRKRG